MLKLKKNVFKRIILKQVDIAGLKQKEFLFAENCPIAATPL